MPPSVFPSARSIVLGVVCALVVGFYAWLGGVCVTQMSVWSPAEGHYNLLVDGFRHGHLSLEKAAPPELGQLADPYDPVANSRYRHVYGLHDMTYYRGKLYLYFGVTPALLLFWPWRVLTGTYLYHRYAVAVFCAVGFLASAGLLRALWRRYFPEVGAAVVAAGVLALGLANGALILLQRAEFWEVAVSCGYALIMLALGAVWLALHVPARRGWWLAAASLMLGLAVGARPFLLLGAPILLIPIAQAWRAPAVAGPRRFPWRLLAAALLPLVLCGLGLMLYNYLRFDNPFEFGERYQLAGDRQDTIQHFSLRFLWFNFCVNFLEPVRWSWRPPFVGDITTPAMPAGHADIEDPFGLLTNVPVVWLALAVPLVWRARAAEARAVLRGAVAAIAMLFGVCAAVLCLFYGDCSRYEVEYLPALVLLAVIGILGVERALAGRPRQRLAVRVGWGLLLAFSVTFNLLAGLDRFAVQRSHLGNVYDLADRFPAAEALYRTALRIKPDYVEAHSNLGNVLRQLGRVPEAAEECRIALRLNPDYAKAHDNLGNALMDEGRIPEAITHYETALRLAPDDAQAHYNFAIALFRLNRVPEAIAQYETSLRIAPDNADTHYNLANALLTAGRGAEAIQHFQETLQIKPAFVDARNNLGNALLYAGRIPEAINQLAVVVRLKPDYAEGHNNLGAALYQAGRIQEAIVQFQAALRLKPDYADARANLERMLKLAADKGGGPGTSP